MNVILDNGTQTTLYGITSCFPLRECKAECEPVLDSLPEYQQTFDSYNTSNPPPAYTNMTYDGYNVCPTTTSGPINYTIMTDASLCMGITGNINQGQDKNNPSNGNFVYIKHDGAGIETGELLTMQSVPVNAGKLYSFRLWYMNTESSPMPNSSKINLKINGARVEQGSPYDKFLGIWSKLEFVYDPGAITSTAYINLSVEIEAIDAGSFGIDYISFTEITKSCPISASPHVFPEEEFVNPCVQTLLNIAQVNAQTAYNAYLDGVKSTFRQNYIEKCLDAKENFFVDYEDREHHYTLYYYDQGGNLIKTVPPEGVSIVTNTADLQQVASDRFYNTHTFHTSHSFLTKYEYNSLNQLIRQSTPDHDLMDMFSLNTMTSGYPAAGTTFFGLQSIPGQGLLAVGDDGTNGVVYKFNSVSGQWTEITAIGPGDFKAIHVLPSGKAFAAGSNGSFYRRLISGGVWNKISLPVNTEIRAMHFYNDNEGVICGTNASILKTIDGGDNWTIISSAATAIPAIPQGSSINALYDFSGILYAGGSGGLLIYSPDQAVTWNSIAGNGSAVEINALQVVYDNLANTNIIFVGAQSASHGIVRWKDLTTFGATWSSKVFSNQPVSALNFIDHQIGVVGSINGFISRTTDGGTTWNQEFNSSLSPGTITGIELLSGDGYASSHSGQVLRYDGVSSWDPLGTTGTTEHLHTLDAISSTEVYAVGNKGTILKYNGTTWNAEHNYVVKKLRDVHVAADNFGTVYAVGENGYVIKSTDYGTNWADFSIGGTINLNSLYFINSDNGVLVGDGGTVYSTADGAATPFVTVAVGTTNNLNDVVLMGPSDMVAVGNGATILKYSYAGGVWNPVIPVLLINTTITVSLNTVFFTDPLNGYAGGGAGTVLRTTDGGTIWNSQTLSSPFNINDINFTSANNGYVFGSDAGVATTVDAGITWNIQSFATGGETYQAATVNSSGIGSIAGSNDHLQMVSQQSDFSTRMYYDRLGRLVISQNSKQFNKTIKAFSYTLYDALNRIVEVGEISQAANQNAYLELLVNSHGVISNSHLTNWLAAGVKTEITRTSYDVVNNDLANAGFIQDNLRNRVSSVALFDDDLDPNYDHASFYSYDIHGNVKRLIHHNPSMAQYLYQQEYKVIDYSYELVSGNVNTVAYQPNSVDKFYHRYYYDADNRITEVFTSRDSVFWTRDARYQYYKHGPLARTEIGDQKVQGLDYIYTLQGWLKGVNSNILNTANDPGKDGISGTAYHSTQADLHRNVTRDAFGYSLNYFNSASADDYQAINSGYDNFEAAFTGVATLDGSAASNNPALYNGNISAMVTSFIDKRNGSSTIDSPIPQLTAYKYDQLNRISQMRAYKDVNLLNNNDWNTAVDDGSYATAYTYDANGNLVSLTRNGTSGNLTMDNLSYHYQPGKNRLRHVNDVASTYTTDIDNQVDDNYRYDEIGNLTYDEEEEIDEIVWSVYGKIKEIKRISSSSKADLEFKYDASGNRIAKIVKTRDASGALSPYVDWIVTYYVRDASGNTMATYIKKEGTDNLALNDMSIYGSSRLGVKKVDAVIAGPFYSPPYIIPSFRSHFLGTKEFELSNHLGNVLTVVSDRRMIVDDPLFSAGIPDGIVDYYNADIISSQDYYPFGSIIPDRSSAFDANYRYTFNGQEKDDEVKGSGNSYDFEFRIYDSRIARFLSTDPIAKNYPFLTPYQFASNTPIWAKEFEGLEAWYTNDGDQTDFSGPLSEGGQEEKYTFSESSGVISGDTRGVKDITVNVVHGSKPAPGAADEGKILGGMLGGHAAIEVGENVFGFTNRDVNNNNPNDKLPLIGGGEKIGTYEAMTSAQWTANTASKKITTFNINTTLDEYYSVLQTYKDNSGNLNKPNYNYSILGVRCASSLLTTLNNSGIIEGTKMTTNYIHAVNPQALIKYLSDKASGNSNITIGGQDGSKSRVWSK
ncbi:MAG: hypothetical protein M3Q58_11270 [Bacteroidota bacterium]|nr:hypothetical protein [Bacteroidota bacterium]